MHRSPRCLRPLVSGRRAGHVACVSLLFFMSASYAAAQVRPARITVRAYNTAGVSSRELAQAVMAAGDLLQSIGVDVLWRECGIHSVRSPHDEDRCDDPLTGDELMVRVVRAPRRGLRDIDELGFSYVDASRKTGTLATVFADRVHLLASQVDTLPGVLLGRAMAHEIGHLLLGTTEHSRDGLMRPHWAVRSGTLNQGKQWQFSVADAVAIRSGVAVRTAEGVVASRVTWPLP